MEFNEKVEESLRKEVSEFPFGRFTDRHGRANTRKIKQLHKDFQEDALNLIFITKALAVHGDTYGYAGVKYKTANQYVTIICRAHGEFMQLPRVHLQGSGCPICAKESRYRLQHGDQEWLVKGSLRPGLENPSESIASPQT